MWERETRNREEVLEVLACEADDCMYRRDKLNRKFASKGWGGKIEGLRTKMHTHYGEVRQLEYDYLELKREVGTHALHSLSTALTKHCTPTSE
jgi:hypothetical protein